MSSPYPSNISTQASLSTRIQVWIESIPIFTRSMLFLCGGIYLVGLIVGYDEFDAICLNAPAVAQYLQLYRLFTSAVFHVGLLHVAMNMMAFVPIGSSLERHYGTFKFAVIVLLLIVFGDATYIGFTYLLAIITGASHGFLNTCALGLSGVIFGLIVVDNTVSGAQLRSVFGLFTVPANLYPWALLILWQLLVPGVSFLGHLGGVLGGEALVRGWLRWILPTSGVIQRVEGWSVMGPLVRTSGYIVETGAGGGSLPSFFAPPGRTPAAPSGILDLPLWASRARTAVGSWFSGGWQRVPTEEGHGGTGGLVSGDPQGPSGSSGPFRGHGHTLGTAGQATIGLDPSTAAAAAAEARAKRLAAAEERGLAPKGQGSMGRSTSGSGAGVPSSGGPPSGTPTPGSGMRAARHV
eukprot:jgi/Botrbrau1/6107/Bobra.331_2s0004.2